MMKTKSETPIFVSISLPFLVSFVLAVFFWVCADEPPYGPPGWELSKYYHPLIVDIAHKWRSLQFTLYDYGAGGGTCLFTSGTYPLLAPTNAFAWVMNDNQFFLFKLIEPYMFGCFFMLLLLSDGLKVKWPYAIFGSFLYMGLPLGRLAMIAQMPVFTWAATMFPAMVYFYIKFRRNKPLLGAALAGACVSFQFINGGLTVFPQVVLWWLLFFSVESFLFFSERNILLKFKRFAANCFFFVLMAVGVAAIQFVPTLEYFSTEAARLPGYYPVNSFPLWGSPEHNSGFSLAAISLAGFVTNSAGISMKGVLAILIFVSGLLILDHRNVLKSFAHAGWVQVVWLSTAAYILLSSFLEVLGVVAPVLNPLIYSIFSRFNLIYGIYIVDFCIVILLCLILNNESLAVTNIRRSRRWGMYVFLCIAVTIAVLPVVLMMPFWGTMSQNPFLRIFVPQKIASAVLLAGIVMVVLIHVAFRPRNIFLKASGLIVLPVLGFMTVVTCFNWNHKGERTAEYSDFKFSSPEHEFYKEAAGKYYFPYQKPLFMGANYNLLYGVRGISGYLGVPNYRLRKFQASYHKSSYFKEKFWASPGDTQIESPSGNLSTYFPVDFTTVAKGADLPWVRFKKEIDGDVYDIWVNQAPPEAVRLADRIEVLKYEVFLQKLDEVPAGQTIFVVEEDAQKFSLKNGALADRRGPVRKILNFTRPHQDRFQFELTAGEDSYVVFPEIFSRGWKVVVDGLPVQIFPANYLFWGFKISSGQHLVSAYFTPPGLFLGGCINFFVIMVLVVLLADFQGKGKFEV